jgi:hypothetical protein
MIVHMRFMVSSLAWHSLEQIPKRLHRFVPPSDEWLEDGTTDAHGCTQISNAVWFHLSASVVSLCLRRFNLLGFALGGHSALRRRTGAWCRLNRNYNVRDCRFG